MPNASRYRIFDCWKDKVLIVFLSMAILFCGTGCNSGTNDPGIGVTESDECVEHSSEAVYSPWGECEICEAMSGKVFVSQCDSWEDIIRCSSFDKYSYELSVNESDNLVYLSLTFDVDDLFSNNEYGVHYFLKDAYLGFISISWFTQNLSSVEAPLKFQKFAVIKLNFTGGTIVCTTNDYTPLGISTSLYVDEEELVHKFKVERVYKSFFKSVD